MKDLYGNIDEEGMYQMALEYEMLWKRGFKRYFDKYKGLPKKNGGERAIEKFTTVESLWNWWVSGKAYEGDKPDCQMFLW